MSEKDNDSLLEDKVSGGLDRIKTIDPQQPYADQPDQEVVDVLGVGWVFQQPSGTGLKKIQDRCRNRRTGEISNPRFLQELCQEIILGVADEQGQPIPGTKFDPNKETARVTSAMEDALISFLFDE